MESNNDLSTIQRFYEGTNVFLTGGTGFLGKVLIEKLLRSTGVATIYMLVREKKGKGVHSRVDELLDDIIFDKLKVSVPKFKHRVVGIAGDCALAGLGISITDRSLLAEKVHIVIHAAATVRFDERLDLAYTINVTGTGQMIDLCRQMEQLKSFVHVSTAYANCHLKEIGEKFYDYPVSYGEVGAMLDKLDPATIDANTPKILGEWPNTYAYTKALAEALIKEHSAGLPIGIFRPAIVSSAYKEPIPSWIDNLYGATGVCAGVASGVLRTLECADDFNANIVPVDTCVAGLIAAVWDTQQQYKEKNIETPIYNYVSSTENPVTWLEYNSMNSFYGRCYPLLCCTGPILFKTTVSKNWHNFYKIILHFIPAIIIDLLCLLTGRKPKMLQMYKKIHKFTHVISHFCTNEWVFTNDNVQRLYESLDAKDKILFPLSMKNVQWLEYFRTYLLGIRQYLIKENENTLEQARIKARRFEILFETIKFALAFGTISMVWRMFSYFL